MYSVPHTLLLCVKVLNSIANSYGYNNNKVLDE